MKIPETQTDKDFPPDVVKHFTNGGVLQRVTGTDGRTLWSLPPKLMQKEKSTVVPKPEQAPAPAAALEVSKAPATKTSHHANVPVAAKQPGVEGKTLPGPVLQALIMNLGNAQFQTLHGGDEMRTYHYGVLFGLQAAIGILCGGLGYDLNYLMEVTGDTEPSSENGNAGDSSQLGAPTKAH